MFNHTFGFLCSVVHRMVKFWKEQMYQGDTASMSPATAAGTPPPPMGSTMLTGGPNTPGGPPTPGGMGGNGPNPSLVPCGPGSGPHNFVPSPSVGSGSSTPGPCINMGPNSGGGPPPFPNQDPNNMNNNCGPPNFLPPTCGPGGPDSCPSSMGDTGPPMHGFPFNDMPHCGGPGIPNSPSLHCGPPSHSSGQSPHSRPVSSGPPFPYDMGPNDPCGPIGPGGLSPHFGQHGPPPPHFLGPPGGPNGFGPHGPGPGFGPPHGPMGPHGPLHGPPPPFMERRPMPIMPVSYKISEMNKRLQQRTDDSDNFWWDAFATEFFEDESQLILTFCLEDGPKRYCIGRTLIPRFFRSIFEGGVTELQWDLKNAKESMHAAAITLDCDQAMMVTEHGKPMFAKVYAEGRLIIQFGFDDMMRIRSWHLAIRNHREFVPRSVLSNEEPDLIENLSKNITRQGMTAATLNYLRLCEILEPMKELMSRHKAYALSPRDCLKTTLFQKWQKMVAPPESTKPTNKRRKRKGSAAGGAGHGGPNKKGLSPGGANFSLASQDAMIVGEPSLMGGDFGEEDERLITRLENSQYDPSLCHSMDNFGGPGGGVMPGGGPGNQPPPAWADRNMSMPPSSHELEIKQSPPSSL